MFPRSTRIVPLAQIIQTHLLAYAEKDRLPQLNAELTFWRDVSAACVSYNFPEDGMQEEITRLQESAGLGFQRVIDELTGRRDTARARHTPFACYQKLPQRTEAIQKEYRRLFPDATISDQVRARLEREHAELISEIDYKPPAPHPPRPVNEPAQLQGIIDFRASTIPKTSVDIILSKLSPQNELYLRLSYGIGMPRMTMRDIGEQIGGRSHKKVSPSQIREICGRAQNALASHIGRHNAGQGPDENLSVLIDSLRRPGAHAVRRLPADLSAMQLAA